VTELLGPLLAFFRLGLLFGFVCCLVLGKQLSLIFGGLPWVLKLGMIAVDDSLFD
jgi:hypothetical protein